MEGTKLANDFWARGVLLREHIERIFIKTEAHVIRSDLKNLLGVPSQVRQPGRVVRAQPQGFITKQGTGRILLPPESETLARLGPTPQGAQECNLHATRLDQVGPVADKFLGNA